MKRILVAVVALVVAAALPALAGEWHSGGNNVCTDCHKKFDKDFPNAAAVVAENDRLWKVLRQVQAKNKDSAQAVPEQFAREVGKVRAATAKLMHTATTVSPAEATALNERVHKLSDSLEEWLRTQK